MAIARLNHPSRIISLGLRRGWLLLATVVVGLPTAAMATGGFDDEPPPTLPYYLDRLPAKPPALIFQETFGAPTGTDNVTDFKAALLSLASDCDKGRAPAALLTDSEKLLSLARFDPKNAAALCNVLNDVRDLFAANPPASEKSAADYVRWRVEHAGWFRLPGWSVLKTNGDFEDADAVTKRQHEAATTALDKILSDPKLGPLRVHWLYLRAACDYPTNDRRKFQQVVDSFPDHPRAEAARFMLARCGLVASRSHGAGYGGTTPEDTAANSRERARARDLFDDYLKRYPKGRFAADVPGWLGAMAFDEQDYLRALDCYIQQAEVPGHPEVLKSAGFMCERCLSQLASGDNALALARVAAHPHLAMSLIYLLVNSPESNNYDGQIDPPAQVVRWRQALLPKLAAEVVARKDAYTGGDWQPRYLAILAQASSGTGDQTKALALCDMAKSEIAHNDDLAFIRFVALSRAHRLPDAIAAGRDFARQFLQSPLAPGAALRLALAMVDNHQAGVAIGELRRLQQAHEELEKSISESGEDDITVASNWESVYPSADGALSATRSVLQRDTSGAESQALAQVVDTLLNFAPLPELGAALPSGSGKPGDGSLDGENAAELRAVLVQRWLSEEENFTEARKYATPAQWDVAAAALEKLAAEAVSSPVGEPRAEACLKLAEGWAAARGKLLYAPLETEKTRGKIFAGAKDEGIRRRENGLALGLPADRVNLALSSRDEWRHAFDWWLKAADVAPPGSPTRARALWAALRAMPSIAVASPYTFLRAGETDATALSRKIYDRLRHECPDSREAREFAVYSDLAPAMQKSEGRIGDQGAEHPDEPNLSPALVQGSLPYGEPEYRWSALRENGDTAGDEDDGGSDQKSIVPELTSAAVALGERGYTSNLPRLTKEVARLRAELRGQPRQHDDMFLVNFVDDLSDFLQEPAAKLTPKVVERYVKLRTECMSVEHWGGEGSSDLPPVPDAGEDKLNEAVLSHIRAAYRAPEMAAVKDYLDFLALAVVANSKFEAEIPGEVQEAKDGTPGKKEPLTYTSRDYPKLAKLAEGFLHDYSHSRKREAARLLLARALYAASRPHPREKFAVWPESGHFADGTIIVTDRQAKFEPPAIGAALNAYDREFPKGRYAGEIRNLRGLLAWRTQDWGIALNLTLQTLADKDNPALHRDAARRLNSIFVDGLTDETERQSCLKAIKAHPEAVKRLREFLPESPYPLRAIQSWVVAQL